MAKVEDMTREQKLLLVAAVEVEMMETCFSGHNTAWGERVDLVLCGRKGLLDYSDDELDTEVSGILSDEDFEAGRGSVDSLMDWARRISFIGSVDPEKKLWLAVPEAEQRRWREEAGA